MTLPTLTPDLMILAGIALLGGLAIGAVIAVLTRAKPPEPHRAAEEELAKINARMDAMGNWLQTAHGALQQTVQNSQGQFQHAVNQRLDAVTARLGETLSTSTKNTTDHLQQLHARLAVIDSAQKNITELSTTVSTLQKVFDNKQRRGAFGQGRMETIIADALPMGAYEFQYTLSNRSRPDCCIKMPDNRPLVIDAKFPLEAISEMERATTEEQQTDAARKLRVHLGKHIGDIADKYLIPGETQDLALMFVPSESVYTELHDHFDDIIQKAYRARVMIVSPSLLMLAVQVIQQIQKDAKMREAADKIHAEVGHLMDDLGRLRERVNKLGKHFNDANEDVRQVLISADKIEKRGERIQNVEFGEVENVPLLATPQGRIEAAE
ncbi:MAG: DNA recombination protein RmuC [Pseudolabrys sp.]|nr:DNA recombination protein RmuC [Pseudolabrys sp.]